MILTGDEISERIKTGDIEIDPYDPEKLGPNSYNLSLSDQVLIYDEVYLDCSKQNRYFKEIIPETGLLIRPHKLYLAMTQEKTKVKGPLVPMLEGRSSVGRLGICIHATAGFGDIGYEGKWTLEISCIEPVKIYPNMEICQIYYHEAVGELSRVYKGKYQGATEPQPSKLWKELQ